MGLRKLIIESLLFTVRTDLRSWIILINISGLTSDDAESHYSDAKEL